jgi:hypothetical protein
VLADVRRCGGQPPLVQGDRQLGLAQAGTGSDQLVVGLVEARIELDRPLVLLHRLPERAPAMTFQQVAVADQQAGIRRLIQRPFVQRSRRLVRLFVSGGLVPVQELVLRRAHMTILAESAGRGKPSPRRLELRR